jgi:hypothetical protein
VFRLSGGRRRRVSGGRDSSAQIVARSSAFCPYPASAQLERESAALTRARLRVGSFVSFPSSPLGLLEARTLRAFCSNNSVRCCFWGTRRPRWVSACRAVWRDRFRVSATTELPAALLLRTANWQRLWPREMASRLRHARRISASFLGLPRASKCPRKRAATTCTHRSMGPILA